MGDDETPFADILKRAVQKEKVKSKVTKQPEPQIRTSQFISSRLRLFDGEQELQLTNAHFERFEQENGILFTITLESSEEVFLFVQLAVVGDQELDAVQKSENNIQPRVLDTHESRCENCKVGRACDKARYSSIGVTESNEVLLYLIITEPTPLDATGNPQAFRLLLTLVNSTEPTVISEAIIIKEDLVVGQPPLRGEVRQFFHEIFSSLLETPTLVKVLEALKSEENNREELDTALKGFLEDLLTQSKNRRDKMVYSGFSGNSLLHYVAYLNLHDSCELILKHSPESVQRSANMNGITPLHFAVQQGSIAILKQLLEVNAPIHAKDCVGQTALDYATIMKREEMIKLLNEKAEQLEIAERERAAAFEETVAYEEDDEAGNYDPEKKQSRILLQAAFKGSLADVQLALQSGIPLSSMDSNGATALHVSCLYGHVECARFLIQSGATLNFGDNDGSTPLHKAAYSGETDCVALLLEQGADVNARDSKGATPLHIAAYKNRLPTARVLLAKSTDVNAADFDGVTPLHHTCFQGHLDFTRLLIEGGAQVSAKDKGGATPLHNACFNGHYEIAELLVTSGAQVTTPPKTTSPLHHAAFYGNAKCLRLLLNKGADPNSRDEEGSTPTHKSSFNGHLECLKVLLEYNVDISAHDDEGSAPLHQAAFSGKADCVGLLLEVGADVEIQDNEEGTALHNACFNGHTKCVELLLASQANFNCADSRGASPLHFAVMNGHKECASLLVGYGASLDVADDEGQSPLHQAVAHPECIAFLLEKGAEIDPKDTKGRTPLFIAVENGCEQSARLLIQKGADIEIKDSEGRTLLEIADEYIKKALHDASKEKERRQDQEIQKQYEQAVKKFNQKPKEGFKFLKESGLGDSPQEIAKFLHNSPGLNKTKVGEVLGEPDEYNLAILKSFLDEMDFTNLEFDTALRHYLVKFKLPGEAQKIDRMMERFAHRYCDNNPGIFPTQDAHSAQIKNKMTKEQFVKNNTGFSEQDLSHELLGKMYDKIITNEIKMETEASVFVNTEKKGFLTKQGGRIKTWKKRFFILSDGCLYYFKHEQESTDKTKKPTGIIPLEDIRVRKVEKKKNCFEMYHPNKDQVKAVKMSSGQTTKGHHDSYLICAANEQEMEDWVSAIENSSFTNPYQQLLEERKRKQQQLTSQTTANGKGAKDKKEEKKAGGNKRAKKAPDVKIDFDELCDMANMCSVAVKTASGIKELCGSGAIVDPPINDVNYFIVIQHRLKKQRVVISGTKWDTSSKLKAFMGKDLGAEHAELQRTAEAIKKRCLTCLKKEFGTDICGNSVGSPVALFVSLLLQLEGFKISKVVTYGQPKFIRPDSLNEYIGLPVLRVIEHDDPVCSLFSGFVHYGNKVLLLNDSNYCSLKDSDQDHEVKISGPEDLNDQRLAHHHITYYLRLLKPKVGVKVSEVSYDDRKKYLG